MRLVIFVSLIAAVAANSAKGAFPALPEHYATTDNKTVSHSTVQLFHNIDKKTCQLSVKYDANVIALSSLITAFAASPAGSMIYGIPLVNTSDISIGATCDGGLTQWQTISNTDSESYVVLASSADNVQFTRFDTSATGFFPTFFSETYGAVTEVNLIAKNGSVIPVSQSVALSTIVEEFDDVKFLLADGNQTNKTLVGTTFATGEKIAFWYTSAKTIVVLQLTSQGASVGRLNIVNGVTNDQSASVIVDQKAQLGGETTAVMKTVAYGETAAFSFAQGDLLSGLAFYYPGNAEKATPIPVDALKAQTWGDYLLAGFNATLVLVGKSNETATATIFLDNDEEVRAAIESGVKSIVRFANAMAVAEQLDYTINSTEAAKQHAVRRILRPQGVETFSLGQGEARAVNIQKEAISVEAKWEQNGNPEVNGTFDVLGAAAARPDALAFNVFTIGDPTTTNAAFKPKQVTTYDAPASVPTPPAPADESNFWSQPWPYIVIAAFVLVVFGGGFYFYKKHKDNSGSEGKPLLG